MCKFFFLGKYPVCVGRGRLNSISSCSIPSNHASPKSPGKAAQEEAIIQDLKHFFNQQKQEQETKSDVKEVTKLEMRNDLSKRQLLYILLASLLEDHQASAGPLLKAKIPLFQTVSS